MTGVDRVRREGLCFSDLSGPAADALVAAFARRFADAGE